MTEPLQQGEHHPASRYRAGDGVLFSSSKAPPGPGIENCCELPLGFIWTPLSPTDNISVINSNDATLPPVLCLTCLSYLNLYATFDAETGEWICPLCEAKNIAPSEAFATPESPLSSVLVSPALEFRQQITSMNSVENEMDICNVILVMDKNLSCNEAQGVGSAIQSILSDMADKPCRIHLGLIVFGRDVSIYQLGIYGMASADCFSSHAGLTEEHLNDRSYFTAVKKDKDDLDNLMRCLAAVYGVFSVLETDENEGVGNPTAPASRMERLRQRKEARLRRQQLSMDSSGGTGDGWSNGDSEYMPESPWTTVKEKTKSAPAARCTGEAIQCAIDMATAGTSNEARTSRILLFTNGCPNYGDGSVVSREPHTASGNAKMAPDAIDSHTLARSVQYFDIIARSASEAGVGIDVLCSGALELGLQAYQALVEPSAGWVLPHETFATPHLEHNLGFVLKHTFLSTAPLEDPDAIGGESSHNEVWMDGCVIDIRMSEYVSTLCWSHCLSDYSSLLLVVCSPSCSFPLSRQLSDTNKDCRPWRVP